MHWLRLAAAAAALSAAAAALGQEFPTRPIRMIVGFAPGGPTDVIARVMAQDMTANLRQSVLVENRAGANSMIGTEAVAKAAPDGYTLLVSTLAHNVNPILAPDKVKYHPVKDFAAISLAAVLPMIAVTGYDSPIQSVRDIVARAKASPGSITYGSAGNGGSAHLAAALLETRSGTQMTHVPFKGNAPALTEVIAGRVSFMFYPMIGIADQVAQKRLRPLGISTPTRHPDFPTVPTMAEAGYPGFEEYSPGVGYLAPAGTPAAIINKLADAMGASLARPETRERMRVLGANSVGSTPAEFATWLQQDYERWARVIKAAGVKPE
jgi:tripartite-type tricarboxylate transporter receptor subunit TctC